MNYIVCKFEKKITFSLQIYFSKSRKFMFLLREIVNDSSSSYYRGVVPRGAGGAMAPPDFGRSVNPISTKEDKLCPPNNTGTLGFSDLPTALIIGMNSDKMCEASH